MGDRRLVEVICVCAGKDIETWKRGSVYVVKNIDAARYQLIVPDHEVSVFRGQTVADFDVAGEGSYGTRVRKLLKERLPEHHIWRLGWYLQQFIKINRALQLPAESVGLIWDADTIPLKPLHFIDNEGRLVFYKAEEYHEPYFHLIEKLMGFSKLCDFSFISQSLPFRRDWVKSFCNSIEERFAMPWDEALIREIDFEQLSGFSEYETLGTYFFAHFSDEMVINDNPWTRKGARMIGDLRKVNAKKLAKIGQSYDYAAFEAWHKKKKWWHWPG